MITKLFYEQVKRNLYELFQNNSFLDGFIKKAFDLKVEAFFIYFSLENKFLKKATIARQIRKNIFGFRKRSSLL